MKILLAEDERALSRASVHILSKNGYDVTPAYDGEETLSFFYQEHFDLLILDVMMPKKTGIEVLQEIRKTDSNIKILMLTAKSEIEDKLLGFDNNADDYMTKPFDYRELIARIKRLLKDVNKKESISFGNMILDVQRKNICNVNNKNANCSLMDDEVKLLEKLCAFHTLSKSIVFESLNHDEYKTQLYIKYINNKLKSLSSNMMIYSDTNNFTLGEAHVS